MSGRDDCLAAEGFNNYHHCKKRIIEILAGLTERPGQCFASVHALLMLCGPYIATQQTASNTTLLMLFKARIVCASNRVAHLWNTDQIRSDA